MTRIRPKHPPVVYVEWVDTATAAPHWERRESVLADAEKYLEPIVAAGFLLADEERGIVIALLYNDHADDAGHVVIIPRFAVTKMVQLRPGHGFTREPS